MTRYVNIGEFEVEIYREKRGRMEKNRRIMKSFISSSQTWTRFGCFLLAMGIGMMSSSVGATPFSPISDLRLGLNGRTYPVGIQLAGSAGWGQAFWGQAGQKVENGKPNWKYGYARLALNGATSAVVNRVGAEFQLFPVSIFGLGVGWDVGSRNFVPPRVDCSAIDCNGAMTRTYLRMMTFLGAGDFILSLTGRYEELRAPDSKRGRFFDEMTLVTGNSSGESVLTWTPILLYKLNEAWQVGGAWLYSRAIQSGGDSSLYGPVVGYRSNHVFSAVAGVGLNRSPVVPSGIAGFFVLQWMLKAGVGIVDAVPGARINIPAPQAAEEIAQAYSNRF
jgi:hypothetical protein